MRSPNRFRRNPGHSRLRQQMAPQPDANSFRANQGRPQDHLRRAGLRPGGQPGTMQPGYGQFLDVMNPNKDAPLPGGLNNAQVKWMKQNLLGRTGDVTGREGARFQSQIGNYIKQAGGMDAFQQMLGAMPGYGRRADAPGAYRRNTYDPVQGRSQRPGGGQGPQQGPSVGPIKNGPLGANQPPPVGTPSPVQPQPVKPPVGQTLPQTRQQATGQMFPQQAQAFAPQQQAQFQSTVQDGGGGTGPTHPPSGPVPPPAQQGRGQQQGREALQVRAREAGPQEKGAALARDPSARASALAYGGETDPERQKAHEREFFGKRGIPLTPEVEEGMRMLTDEFIQTMIQIGYTEADAAAYVNMTKERLATDLTQSREDVNEAAANSGLFNSGLRLQQQADTGQQFGRSFQDLAMEAAQQERAIADARAAAIEAMRQGRQELAIQGTRQGVQSAIEGDFSGLRTGKRKTRRRGNR